jgi:hypothetical protein
MKKGYVVLGVLVLVALIIAGMYVGPRNEMVRKNETVKSAAPRRSNPEPGGNRERLRGAGTNRIS